MDMPDHATPETAQQAALRVAREREALAEAEADIAAGRWAEWSVVKDWLVQLDHDPDASPPQPQVLPPTPG